MIIQANTVSNTSWPCKTTVLGRGTTEFYVVTVVSTADFLYGRAGGTGYQDPLSPLIGVISQLTEIQLLGHAAHQS